MKAKKEIHDQRIYMVILKLSVLDCISYTRRHSCDVAILCKDVIQQLFFLYYFFFM